MRNEIPKINVPNPKVPENLFKRIYLPGLMNAKDSSGRERWLDEIAKNPFVRVDVVSDTNHDEILFWVPQTLYTPEDTSDKGLVSKLNNANLTGDRLTSVHRNNELKQTTLNMFKHASPPEEDTKQWGIILTRYGLATPITTGPSKFETAGVTNVPGEW